MQISVKFSSARLMLTLLLCGMSVILLENYNLAANQSLASRMLSIASGVGLCIVLFLPAAILRKNKNADICDVLKRKNRVTKTVFAIIFAVYLLFTSEYFLLKYTDMFTKKYYTDAPEWLIAVLFLAVCAYAAYRGANAVTRFSIFLFGLALIVYALIFGGAVGELKFSGEELRGGCDGFINDLLFFVTPSFAAVIFSLTSGYTEKFRLRHIFISGAALAAFFAAEEIFERFALGAYANQQEYRFFLLSKIQRLGEIKGMEAMYMAVVTTSVFCLIALSVCAVNYTAGGNVLLNSLVFPVILLVLHFCATSFISVREILSSVLVLDIFSAIALAAILLLAVGYPNERRNHA